MDKARKKIELKEVTDEGMVVAVFATMNVIDKDGDVSLPGFFGKQEVVMLPAHDWRHIPLGKGEVTEDGQHAIARIKMNLAIPEARNWHAALKFDLENGAPLQEWSYGFNILEGGSAKGEFDGQPVRFLKPRPDGSAGSDIHEVSPVLVGAGEGTHTLAVKHVEAPKDDEGKGKKFCDEAAAALDAVKALVARAAALADLRAKQGRGISADNTERLKDLRAGLLQAAAGLEPFVQDEKDRTAALSEFARFAGVKPGA